MNEKLLDIILIILFLFIILVGIRYYQHQVQTAKETRECTTNKIALYSQYCVNTSDCVQHCIQNLEATP